jgi:hypothetical protein
MSYDELVANGIGNPLHMVTADELVERIRQYVAVGVTYFNFYIPQVAYEPERLHRLAEEVIPHLQE